MPGELTAKGKVVGLKQTRRALVQGAAAHVYLACDADPRLTDPLRALCAEKAIPCDSSMTLRQLGTACGIAVPAAAALMAQGLEAFFELLQGRYLAVHILDMTAHQIIHPAAV